jgi:hypothetical protein
MPFLPLVQSDTLELENLLLKDLNEEQRRAIRRLETEVTNLKQATMVHEHERRRAESKVSFTDAGGLQRHAG